MALLSLEWDIGTFVTYVGGVPPIIYCLLV
jgi:hypothetical protein